ncbi:MAG: SDR family oxidoreductase [Helicobacter sp.]|nr:SDR family oxidoreductase [Helicobacter sp.]
MKILKPIPKETHFILALILSFFLGTNALAANAGDKDFEEFKNKGEGKKILIIGANGSVAKVAIDAFLKNTKVDLKLYLRNAKRLESLKSPRVELIEGDGLDIQKLKSAMKGVDVVYANLAGDLPKLAQSIITAMKETGIKRLIWISSFGVYNESYPEIPEYELNRIRAYIPPHIEAVKLIEASDLDYTIIRAEWFSSKDEIDYELTKKGEAFKNPSALISRKSIAHLIIRLSLEPNFGIRESFGINKPE